MIRKQRSCEIAGRALIHFSLNPLTWAAGVGLLSVSKILENMEIGHNVMHGQYDWMNEPALNSQQYDWDNACDAESWRKTRDASRHLADHLGEAPAIVLFLQPLIPWTPSDEEGEMDIGRLDASVYPAVQNFCVAARSLGLGTAVTTVIRIHGPEVLAALGVPEGRYEIAALVPVGRPAGRFGVAPRKPAAAVTHHDRWGAKR